MLFPIFRGRKKINSRTNIKIADIEQLVKR